MDKNLLAKLLTVKRNFVSNCKYLLLLLLPFLGLDAYAQSYHIVGTPVSTTSTSGLSSSTSTGARIERHTCIYPAAELLTSGLSANSVITGIAWDKSGAAAYDPSNLTIRVWIKHTAANIFAANPTFATETSAATLVYETTSGTIAASTGWLSFIFNNGTFTWNGTDALQVITELVRPGSWTATGFDWTTIAAVTNAAANANNATTPPATLTRTSTRPQIRLEAATSGNDAGLMAMPLPVNGLAGPQNITVALRNTGTNVLTAASISYTINGGTPSTFNWTGSLGVGASTPVVIGTPVFANGVQTIVATITGANGTSDAGPGNNVISKTVQICSPLSGSYTINNLAPSSATNFSSFNEFSQRLTNCGVNGNVIATVNAEGSPYAEQVTFANISGAGPSATITVQGSGATITALTNADNRHVVRLENMQYFTINNLRIERNPLSASGFMGIHLLGSGSNITLSNNEVDMVGTTSTLVGGLIASGSTTSILAGGDYQNINFTGNTTEGGGYGISLYGIESDLATDVVISGNQINGFNSNGIYIRETDSVVIHGNYFDKDTGSVSATNAIQLAQTANINGVISNNYIKMSQTTGALRGIYLFGGTGHKVFNNVITDIHSQSGEITGIQLREAASAPMVYNNTVSISNSSSTTGNLYGIRIETQNTGAVLRNNVINVSQATSGFKAGIMLSANTNVSTTINSGNNLIWVPGGNTAGYTNVTTPTILAVTMANWQTLGQDASGYESNPQMNSEALPIPTNSAVQNLGISYGGLTYDFYGITRSLTTPDLGAYEYNLPLPVKLATFTGAHKDGVNKLCWITETEKYNKGFEVMRSSDGISFTTLGWLDSKAEGGNSNGKLTYNFNDYHPISGLSYYKLKQTDIDGQTTYSAIISINNTVKKNMAVWLYPNPSKGKVFIQILAIASDNTTPLLIVDQRGREVRREMVNIIKGSQTIELNVNDLISGMYYLQMNIDGQTISEQFLKQ